MDIDGEEIILSSFDGGRRRFRKAVPADMTTTMDDDDATHFVPPPAAKRQMSASPSTVLPMMEVSMDVGAPPSSISSADDVLVQMIRQSGAKSCAEVVEFCRATGIPLSRMFRLDLMRELSLPNK